MLTGPADLSKFLSIDPKILFATLGMPLLSGQSWTSARKRPCHAVSLASSILYAIQPAACLLVGSKLQDSACAVHIDTSGVFDWLVEVHISRTVYNAVGA